MESPDVYVIQLSFGDRGWTTIHLHPSFPCQENTQAKKKVEEKRLGNIKSWGLQGGGQI